MHDTSSPGLLVEVAGAVARVTLNRPEKRNALSRQVLLDLEAALTRLGGDPAVRVVVLAAVGPAFCAGHDLGEMTGGTEDSYRTLFALCSRVMLGLRRLPQVELRAAAHLVHDLKRTDVQFGLVGGGTSLEEMKALARELGVSEHVTFTGRVSDQALLAMLNQARSTEQSPALTRDPALDAIAEQHAQAMRQLRRVAHDAGDGDHRARVARAA